MIGLNRYEFYISSLDPESPIARYIKQKNEISEQFERQEFSEITAREMIKEIQGLFKS